MKANISQMEENFKVSYRKEDKLYTGWKVITTKPTKYNDNVLTELIDCRVYFPNTVAYCCLWIHSREKNIYCSGTGKAGGYGYHKVSACVGDAISNMSIGLEKDISGVGDEAVKSALLAIGRELTDDKVYIVDFHG